MQFVNCEQLWISCHKSVVQRPSQLIHLEVFQKSEDVNIKNANLEE